MGEFVHVPVPCLRWSHDDINEHMMFGHHGEEADSIYKLFDQLQRGEKTADDIAEPLDIVDFRGADERRVFYSLSNRRIMALSMYQSLHRVSLLGRRLQLDQADTLLNSCS